MGMRLFPTTVGFSPEVEWSSTILVRAVRAQEGRCPIYQSEKLPLWDVGHIFVHGTLQNRTGRSKRRSFDPSRGNIVPDCRSLFYRTGGGLRHPMIVA